MVENGRVLFFACGCASCHGLRGQGAVVGPELELGEFNAADFRREVRRGPEGMPAFDAEIVPDDDVAAIYGYLESIRR